MILKVNLLKDNYFIKITVNLMDQNLWSEQHSTMDGAQLAVGVGYDDYPTGMNMGAGSFHHPAGDQDE